MIFRHKAYDDTHTGKSDWRKVIEWMMRTYGFGPLEHHRRKSRMHGG